MKDVFMLKMEYEKVEIDLEEIVKLLENMIEDYYSIKDIGLYEKSAYYDKLKPVLYLIHKVLSQLQAEIKRNVTNDFEDLKKKEGKQMESNFDLTLSDFINERIEETYKNISTRNDYIELKSKYKEKENNFMDKLQDKNLKNAYFELQELQQEFRTIETKEIYMTGFRDIRKILKGVD